MLRDYERRIRLKFRILAKFYDWFDLVLLLKKNRNPRYVLARRIPNEPLRVLDVCVGTGNGCIAVAELNDRNKIIGIDLSPDMIAVAERKIRRRGTPNISIQRMDATKMGLKDGQFDVAMVSFGLHELKYELMIAALEEISRVVKEEGRLYIVDYKREDRPVMRMVFSVYLRLFEPSHVRQFLEHDWPRVLGSVGFQVDDVETCFFSKLICARRVPGSDPRRSGRKRKRADPVAERPVIGFGC